MQIASRDNHDVCDADGLRWPARFPAAPLQPLGDATIAAALDRGTGFANIARPPTAHAIHIGIPGRPCSFSASGPT